MLKRFLRWLRGYLFITLKGNYPEHFCNLCSSRNILIWQVRCQKNECSCFVRLKDYKTIKPIARKTHTIPYIKRRFGFPFLLRRIRKRKVYFIGILLFCILLFVMSRFIWDIGIEGGHKYTEEQLIAYLNTIGVYSGCKINEIDCPFIENNIRRDYKDIGWVSAQIKGTRLIVSIVETVNPLLDLEKKKTNLTCGHITATKDGIIHSIITTSGIPQVDIGSVVKKGDIIISGIVPVIGDDQTVIKNKLVLADGNIELKTYRTYNASFSMEYNYREFTGEKNTGFQLNLWNKKIFSLGPRISYDYYDIIKDVNTLKLVRNFYLPVQYTKTKVYEYTIKKAVYTEGEARTKAKEALMAYLEELRENGIQVIENQVEITIKNNHCYAQGRIIVNEPAWDYTKIEDSEWRSLETDELSRDNH